MNNLFKKKYRFSSLGSFIKYIKYIINLYSGFKKLRNLAPDMSGLQGRMLNKN